MPKANPKMIGVRWVTKAQAAAMVDAHARRVLRISGEQFIKNWKSGKYRTLDSDQCPGVIELALLAPLPRQSKRGGTHTRRGSR